MMGERVFVLEGMRGVDLASSVYEVDKNRAVEIDNFICLNGINQKRPAIEEVVKLPGTIYGMWLLSGMYIVHSGNQLYVVDLRSNALSSTSTQLSLPTGVTISTDVSWGIVSRGALYLLCGDYLIVYKKDNVWCVERVINNLDNTYIPTTTISIDNEGAIEKKRSEFEKPNYLSKYRINTLQGANDVKDELDNSKNVIYRTYYLDTSITEGEIRVSYDIISGNNMSSVSGKNKKGTDNKFTEEIYELSSDGSIEDDAKVIAKVSKALGKIIFTNIIKSTNNADDNITVQFPHEESDYVNRISGCKFGTLFGLYGNNDRMFVTGNILNRNVDYYSEANDFTYFPDTNYTIIGNSAISGYSRVGDGTLAIHKQLGDNSMIYYRNSSMEKVTDVETGMSIEEIIFPIKAGSNGKHCVSYRCCQMLNDDTLFLSNNGVYSIVLGSNISTSERYARERSTSLEPELKQVAGVSSSAIVHDGRYYLFSGSKCYIADSRYRSNDKILNDTYNYDWWIWTFPCVVSHAIAIDNVVLLGDNDGRIYILNEHGREDIKHTRYDNGSIALDKEADGTFTVPAAVYAELNNDNIVIISGVISYEITVKKIVNDVETDTKLAVDISNKELKITKKEDNKIQLYEYINSNVIKNITATGVLKFSVVNKTNIVARYVTGMINLGSNQDLKTLSKITVNADDTSDSYCTISVRTKAGGNGYELNYDKPNGLDFSDIDFSDMAFGVLFFACSDVRPLKLRRVNYVQLSITNSVTRNCAVNSISINYNITKNVRGGTI